MNYAQEKMTLEHLRRRLEEAYDRKDWQKMMHYSDLIDRMTVQQWKQSVRL